MCQLACQSRCTVVDLGKWGFLEISAIDPVTAIVTPPSDELGVLQLQ